jgi:hypothetical protein
MTTSSEPKPKRVKDDAATGRTAGWILLGLIVIVFIWAEMFALSSTSTGLPACSPSTSGHDSGTQPSEAPLVELAPQSGSDRLLAPFSSERGAATRTLSFVPSRPLTTSAEQLEITVDTDLVRTDGRATFPSSQITFQPTITSNPDRVRVAVCLDPKGVPQGEYNGTVLVSGPGVKPAPIVVTATLAHTNKRIAFAVAILGAVVGFSVKVYTDDGWSRWSSYVPSLLVGLLAAVAVGYFEAYAGNPVFGAAVTDWITLFGVGFGAVVTGMTAADALGKAGRTAAASRAGATDST